MNLRGLGNMRLVYIFILLLPVGIFASSAEAPSPERLTEWASESEWKKIAESPQREEAFEQLLQQRARWETENWEALQKAPAITDPRFLEYDQYLRLLAAYEQEQFELVTRMEVGENLPNQLMEEVQFKRAQAWSSLKNWVEAKTSFRDFLNRFPRSRRRTEVQLELASIEWELKNKHEALALYREVYTNDISSRADTAFDQLRRFNALESLSLDAHLSRADRLRRAALFEKGVKELNQLKRQLEGNDRDRVDLALAQFEFARRHYQRSESLSRQSFENEKLDDSIRLEWHQLLAFSLVRQGKYDLARVEYDKILKEELPSRDRQQILFRLGLMALDDADFPVAAKHFEELRKKFPNGIYQESSHWFEAWAIFQQAYKASKDPESKFEKSEIESAIRLLERLPRLPEGPRLHAQALYWQAQLEALAGKDSSRERTLKKLQTDWKASFHSLLAEEHGLHFAFFQPHYVHPKLIEEDDGSYRVADPAFQQIAWKRVEAFASAHLYSWAQLELQTFLTRTGSKNEGLQKAVARRLRKLGDWSDLVRYAQNNFPFELKSMDREDPIARLYYPQAYHEEVRKAAKEFEVSPFLIWGVMREESRFQSDVVSPAGAVGLLQLMPSLGAQIARQLKEGKIDRMGLTNPEKNVRYGTHHLKELLQQVEAMRVPKEFHIPLVIASYNAGIGPVRRWTQEIPTDRLDIFVESIPFTETRNYVKRVLQSAHIYYLLYGERVKEFAESKKVEGNNE